MATSRLFYNDQRALQASGSKIFPTSEHAPDLYHPSPDDFGPYISWACNIYYQIREKVAVRNIKLEEGPKERKNTKSSIRQATKRDESKQFNFGYISQPGEESDIASIDLLNGIRIIAKYDRNDNLIQIDFPKKHTTIPQALLKILALIMNFYPSLQKITAKGVLHSYVNKELCNILNLSNVISVNLDDTYSHSLDYSVILTNTGQLKELSLARCSINDEVVKDICDELVYPKPAATTLSQLSLSGNLITSRGLQYIANALRTNRKLYYLNLSGNYITDDGVSFIFDVLQEFPLTFEENYNKKQRHFEHIKKVNMLRKEFARKVREDLKFLEQTHCTKKSKLLVSRKQQPGLKKAKDFDNEIPVNYALMGPITYDDPFRSEETCLKDNTVYCNGNNILCYLNLAYNNLTFLTVKKLLLLLKTQAFTNRKPLGLVKVRLEGNMLPESCQELLEIESIFDAQLKPFNQKGRRLK